MTCTSQLFPPNLRLHYAVMCVQDVYLQLIMKALADRLMHVLQICRPQ